MSPYFMQFKHFVLDKALSLEGEELEGERFVEHRVVNCQELR